MPIYSPLCTSPAYGHSPLTTQRANAVQAALAQATARIQRIWR